MGAVYKDDARDAEFILRKVKGLLGENGENWLMACYGEDKDGNAFNPVSPEACKWCLTGAVYKAIGDPDIYTENYFANGDLRHLEPEGRAFPCNELLALAFCNALQEFVDRTGVLTEETKKDIYHAETLEDSLMVFNDNVDWETVKAFLHYAGLALGLSIDHRNHYFRGEKA